MFLPREANQRSASGWLYKLCSFGNSHVKFHKLFTLTCTPVVQRIADSVLREVFPCIVACGLVENRCDNNNTLIIECVL